VRFWAAPFIVRLSLGVIFLAPPARAAIPAAASSASWTEARSGSFVVLTDMGAGTAITACRNLAQISEALPRTNATLAVVSPLPTYVFVLGHADLFTFCLPEPADAAALFLPALDRNLIIVDGASWQKWPALNHEYLHSHLRANFPGIPVWLDEGIAEFYSTFKLHDTSVEAGGNLKWHSAWLMQYDPQPIDVLFAFNPGAAVYRQGGIMQHTLYAEGWALVQYLQSSREKAEKFDQFIGRYRAGSPPRRAFMESFPEDTWDAMLHDMHQYIAGGFIEPRTWKLREPIDVKDPDPADVPARDAQVALVALKCLEGASARNEAEASCRQVLAERPGEPLCLAGLGMIEDARGDSAAAESLYARVAAVSPRPPLADLLVAQATLERAIALLEDQRAALARAAFVSARGRFQRCLAANPGDLAAAVGWARSFELENPPPAEALETLRKASDALPARADIALSLFALELAAGRKDAASQLVETRLSAILRPADLARAREMLTVAGK